MQHAVRNLFWGMAIAAVALIPALLLRAVWTPGDDSGRWAGTAGVFLFFAVLLWLAGLACDDCPLDEDPELSDLDRKDGLK